MRNYSNISQETTLAAGVTAGDTAISVAAAVGYPSPPFAVALDPGALTEEVVLVTNAVGTTWTVTRGYDGTTAASHSAGVTVRHVVIAADLQEPQNHIANTSNPHATTAAQVGADASGTAAGLVATEATTRAAADTALAGAPYLTTALSGALSAERVLTAGANISFDTSTPGVLLLNAAPGSGTVGGTGTAGRVTQWATGGANIEDSTLAKTGAGVLTLSAASAYTLTVPATGTAVLVGIDNTFSAAQRIVQSGTPQSTSYALSIQSNASTTWLEILNSGGSGAGAFFGMTGNEFQLWNFQNGSTSFWTNSARRLTIALNGRVGVGVTAPSALLHVYAYDTNTGIAPVLTLTHGASSGAPGSGYGARVLSQLDSSTYALRDVAADDVVWVTATDATRKARRTHAVYDTVARETFREEANGTAAMLGVLGAPAIARQTVAADATDLATAITLVNDIKAKLSAAAGGFGFFT